MFFRKLGDIQRYTDGWARPDPSAELSNFIDRMRATQRSFLVEVQTAGSSPSVEVVNPAFVEDPEEAVRIAQSQSAAPLTEEQMEKIRQQNEAVKGRWTDCCKRDYVQRQKRFRERFSNSMGMYRTILMVVLLAAVCLWSFWPLWNILIDVESSEYYKVLEVSADASPSDIRKAYRALAKKWHPDHNPNCGDTCRTMMMRLQEAHDVLLARGDQRETLAAKYSQELSQLRGILYFRVYDICFFNAEFFGSLVLLTFPFYLHAHKPIVRMICRVGSIMLLVLIETLFLSGVNIFILLQMFYFCANAVRQSARLSDLEKIMKRSNFDLTRDFRTFVVPAFVVHALCWWQGLSSRNGLAEFFWHAVVGLTYLAAHLSKFSPNLFDNFALKKCSLSIPYLQTPSMSFTWTSFLWAEFSFLLDDVIVFSSHCPTVYRAVVWGVHLVYLAQLYFLPWDSPVKGKLHKRRADQQQDEAQGSDKNDDQPKTKNDKEDGETNSSSVPLRTLQPWESKLLMQVDDEPCIWYDLVLLKYRRALEAATPPQPAKKEEGEVFQVVLCANEEATEVMICLLTQKPGKQGNREIRGRFHDPSSAQLLAREAGPNGILWFEKVRPPPDFQPQREIPAKYAKLIPQSHLLQSHLYRLQPIRLGGSLLLGGALIVSCLVLCFACLAISPLQDYTPTHLSERLFTARPNRYRRVLPPEHILNAGRGPIVAANGATALLVPDLYEFARQFDVFYQSEEERQRDYGVQAKTTPQQGGGDQRKGSARRKQQQEKPTKGKKQQQGNRK